MAIPSSVTQLLVTLVLVVPGFVYQAVRIRIVGRRPGDTDLPTRVMRAIVISTLFALCYLVILGPEITTAAQAQAQLAEHPRRFALLGLVAAFVLPTISAVLLNRNQIDLKLTIPFVLHPIKTLRAEEWTRYDPRPSAWDVAFEGAAVGFVRVRMSDGHGWPATTDPTPTPHPIQTRATSTSKWPTRSIPKARSASPSRVQPVW